MDNNGHEPTSNGDLAAWSAILGGALLLINWVWHGYLGLSLDRNEILLDSAHYAYYINEFLLFISAFCLLFAIMDLKHVSNLKGLFGELGLYISILGMTLFALGNLGLIVHGFADSHTLYNVIGLCTGVGNLAMHIGAFPLGIALLKGTGFLKISAYFFLLQTIVVMIYLSGIIQLNTFIAGILMGGLYGVGWIYVGLFLLRRGYGGSVE